MTSRKIFDVCAVVSKYTDRDGNEKRRYQNVGAVFQTDDGRQFLSIARWFNPAGVPDYSGKINENAFLALFEPKQSGDGFESPRRAAPQQAQARPAPHPAPAQQGSYDDPPF
ncbi:hypothetical protein IAI58_19125 (plasmid) [Roseomonas marmotae]|uniref:hypothetical protein n=1 Tax=Roseomonas marmotae TaxID=2768161 RepID=UPI001AD71455|nr:hypothetical protein [Roseomonas marmotae]QTI81457.1 hypothetical protein IAI58_19125 [Roseomonas marmotae]